MTRKERILPILVIVLHITSPSQLYINNLHKHRV
jgi:hypothetical protein